MPWPAQPASGRPKVEEVLPLCTRRHGHLRVPQSFQVPAAEPWPASCWRFPLGSRVHSVRNQGQYVSHATLGEARRRELEALGFEWHNVRKKSRQKVGLTRPSPALNLT